MLILPQDITQTPTLIGIIHAAKDYTIDLNGFVYFINSLQKSIYINLSLKE